MHPMHGLHGLGWNLLHCLQITDLGGLILNQPLLPIWLGIANGLHVSRIGPLLWLLRWPTLLLWRPGWLDITCPLGWLLIPCLRGLIIPPPLVILLRGGCITIRSTAFPI